MIDSPGPGNQGWAWTKKVTPAGQHVEQRSASAYESKSISMDTECPLMLLGAHMSSSCYNTCCASHFADPASLLQAIEQHVLSVWPSLCKDMGGPFMVSHVVGKCDPNSDRTNTGKA